MVLLPVLLQERREQRDSWARFRVSDLGFRVLGTPSGDLESVVGFSENIKLPKGFCRSFAVFKGFGVKGLEFRGLGASGSGAKI